MEKIIEIRAEGLNVSRELVCDLCNSDLYIGSYKAEKIYSIFWVERNGDIYLEKYICESCYKKYFSRNKAIPFEQAPEVFQKALKEIFSVIGTELSFHVRLEMDSGYYRRIPF